MNLQKCKYSFIRLTINKTKRYSELKKSGKNQFEFSNYLINTIWNKWNLFWRNYWIVMFISGGVDVKSKSYFDFASVIQTRYYSFSIG